MQPSLGDELGTLFLGGMPKVNGIEILITVDDSVNKKYKLYCLATSQSKCRA